MPEEVAPLESPPVSTPADQLTELPTVTPEMRAAFASPESAPQPAAAEQPPVADPPASTDTTTEGAAPAPTAPATPAATPPVTAPDYGDLLKDLGVDSVDALKARWNETKDYDPKTVETLKAQQRDAHDEAVRNMLADPAKARAYFDLQALPVDALAQGTPEQKRQLLFESYKLANPKLTGRLAELGFKKEYDAKYGLMDSVDPDEAEDAEIAKLQYEFALSEAPATLKAAQEAAKIALVPQPEQANQPSPEQVEKQEKEWLAGMDSVLTQPKVEQVFQTENGPVKVGFDTKDTGLKAFLEKPLAEAEAYLNKIAYPNGFDKPADMNALAQVYLRMTKPEVIATAAAAVGKASVGAHVPFDKLTNPPPVTPQAPAAGGDDQAGVVAAMRAVAQGRR